MSGFHPKDLIKEVKMRPGIYNREELVHPKRDHKHQLWMEVAERLTPPEDWDTYTDVEKEARMDEISTKWKHLKDHFYREIKLQEAGEAHKKRKYIYFDDLEFMRPFVGYKLVAFNKNVKSRESLDNNPDYMENEADMDMEEFLKCGENVEEDGEYKMEDASSPEVPHKSSRLIKSSTRTPQNKINSNSATGSQGASANRNISSVKKPSMATNNHFKIRDGDISFSLSLVPTLRKLSESLKLRAKIDILKILDRIIDEDDRRNVNAQANINQSNSTINQTADVEEDMPEDHLEECEDSIIIKHERHDDPLNASEGNSKTWW